MQALAFCLIPSVILSKVCLQDHFFYEDSSSLLGYAGSSKQWWLIKIMPPPPFPIKTVHNPPAPTKTAQGLPSLGYKHQMGLVLPGDKPESFLLAQWPEAEW